MTQTIVPPTASMQAKAQVLLSEQTRWSRATRKRDGERFWIIPGSTPGTAHMTSASGCTCKSFAHRGACSHVVAVQHLEDQIARAAAHERDIEAAFAETARRARSAATFDRLFGGPEFD